jgi:hypothetical protein
MKPPPELTPEQQEWQELADGYALGELDEEHLQQLYELLRDEQRGPQIAGLTWNSLQLRGTLRSLLDPSFRDLIADRIEREGQAMPGDQGFLGRMLAGIGLQRPRLGSVRVEVPRQRRRWLPASLALLVILTVGLALGWLLGGRHQPLQVESTLGRVSCAGQAIRPGDSIGNAIVRVEAGAELVVAWPDGQRARIVGPASFNAGHDSLSLIEGLVRLRCAEAGLTIGLVECRLNATAGSELVIETGSFQTSAIGLLSGTADCTSDDALLHLEAGQWSEGREVYRWLPAQAWSGAIPRPDGPLWRCEAQLRFERSEDLAEFRADGLTLLRCYGDRLQIGEVEVPFTIPPRQSRRLVIRHAAGLGEVSIDGRTIPLPAGGIPCPQQLVLSGAAHLEDGLISSGPGLPEAP